MNPIKALMAVAVLLMCHEAAAQMFKCVDKSGKVTYSSAKCSDLGLKDAGEVRDRLQVTPAPAATPTAPPPPAAAQTRPASPPPSTPAAQPETPKPAAAADAANPERRCFTTTVKGKSVTRCNDKPDEPAQ